MPLRKKLCKQWDEDACRIDEVSLERLGDFFRVTGKATNLLGCVLPHLRLRLVIRDRRGRQMDEDIFHITDRKLAPAESCRFKIEGEWKRGMAVAEVTVYPYPAEEEG